MKIYLIHDSDRKDREKLYRQELENQGIESVELTPAVKNHGVPATNISRAHKNCVRRAINDGESRVVILEDDVRFACPGAFNRFLEVCEGVSGWDVIITGSYEYGLVDKEMAPVNGLVKLKRFSGLMCYMVNESYYQRMLALPEHLHIDKAMTKGSCEAYMCWPQLALQHPGYSANVRKNVDYDITYKKRINLWDCIE